MKSKTDLTRPSGSPSLHKCLDSLPPPQLTWLFTHCRALGMIKHSDSGTPEEDIALFAVELKQRAERAEETLAKTKAQLESLRPLWMKEKPERAKRKKKPYHVREIENINKLFTHVKNNTILRCNPPTTSLAARIYSEFFYMLTNRDKSQKSVIDVDKAKSLFLQLCDTINQKYEFYGSGHNPNSPPAWLMDLALKSDTIKSDFLRVVSKK